MKSYDNFSWLNMREMEPIVKHTNSAKSEKKAATEPAGNSLPETGAKTADMAKPGAEKQTKISEEAPGLKSAQGSENIENQAKPVERKKESIPSNPREIEKKEAVTRSIGNIPPAHKESKKEGSSKDVLSTNANQKVTPPQKETISGSKKPVQAEALHQGKRSTASTETAKKVDGTEAKADAYSRKGEAENKPHTKTGTTPIPAIRVGTGNTGQITQKPLSGIAEKQPVKAKSVGNNKTEKSAAMPKSTATKTGKDDIDLKKGIKTEDKPDETGDQSKTAKTVLTPSPVAADDPVNKATSDKVKKESKNTLSVEKKEADMNLTQGEKPEFEKKGDETLGDEISDHSSDALILSKQSTQTPRRKMPGKATVIAAAAAVVVLITGVLLVPRFFHKGSEDVVTAEEDGTAAEDTFADEELDVDQTAEAQELESEITEDVEATGLDEEEEKIYGILSSFWLTNINTSEWSDWPQATNESDEDVIVFIRVTSPMEMFKERDADGNLAEFEMEEDIYLFLQEEDDRDTATENHFDDSWIELTEVSREVVEFNGNDEGKGYTYIFAYHCPLGAGESSTTLFDTFKIKSGISSTIEDGENEAIKVQVLAVPASEVKRLISGADTTGEISEANLTAYYKYFYETAG